MGSMAQKKSSTVAGSVMAMVPLQMAMDLGDPPVSNPKGPKPCCGTCNQCHSSSGDMGWKCGNHLNVKIGARETESSKYLDIKHLS